MRQGLRDRIFALGLGNVSSGNQHPSRGSGEVVEALDEGRPGQRQNHTGHRATVPVTYADPPIASIGCDPELDYVHVTFVS